MTKEGKTARALRIFLPRLVDRLERVPNSDREQGVGNAPIMPRRDDLADWEAYWESTGQPWRKRPEIPLARQQDLRERVASSSDVLQGDFPFRGRHLRREDLEWLLGERRTAVSLDLRGADLSGEDLSGLPLSRIGAGLSGSDWRIVDENVPNADRRDVLYRRAEVYLRGASLVGTDLKGAALPYADMRETKLSDCHLEGADLFRANLDGDFPANLHGATFDRGTRLNEVKIASPEGVAPRIFDVQWNGVSLSGIDWRAVEKVADEKRSIHQARKRQGDEWAVHNKRRIIWYLEASQSYRQPSGALREQGIFDHARRFLYRAEVARFWSLLHSLAQPRKWPSFAFSFMLGAISGWGYPTLSKCLSVFWDRDPVRLVLPPRTLQL